MKLKRVAALCRKNKQAIIWEREANMGGVVQYICTSSAAYVADGLPLMDEDTVCAVLDVPPEQRCKWLVRVEPVPGKMDLRDTTKEQPLFASEYQVTVDGSTMQPLQGSGGTLWIDAKNLDPIADSDGLVFAKRTMADGAPYIVAKAGMVLVAAIMPMGISQEATGELARLLATTETARTEEAHE